MPCAAKDLPFQRSSSRSSSWVSQKFCAVVLIGLFAIISACRDDDPDKAYDHGLEIGSAVQLLATTQGELAEQALRRLLPFGRAALPYLEAALHTTQPKGRKRIVMALRRLGLAESAPLLGHIAAYDEDLPTARDAAQALRIWSSEKSPRGDAALKVLHKIDEVRGMEALLLDP